MKAPTHTPEKDIAALSARVRALEEVIVELMVVLARYDRELDATIMERLKAVVTDLRADLNEHDNADAAEYIMKEYTRNAPN